MQNPTDLAGEIHVEPNPPIGGAVWCHVRTNVDYVIDFCTNVDSHDPEQFPLTVVYHRPGELERWSRPWLEFKDRFIQV